jgi:membrane protease YdiL (CAAX protease family)
VRLRGDHPILCPEPGGTIPYLMAAAARAGRPRSRASALLLVLAGLVVLVLGDVLVLLAAAAMTRTPLGATAVVVVVGATAPVALAFVWTLHRGGWLPPAPPRIPHPRAVRTILLAWGLVVVSMAALSVLHGALGVEPREQAQIVEAVRALPAWQIYLSIALLGPIGEEIFFRRFVFTTLRGAFGLWPAHATTSLLFAVVHLNFAAFAIYAVMGLILGLAYERTGRLYVPVAVHAINNAALTAALLNG